MKKLKGDWEAEALDKALMGLVHTFSTPVKKLGSEIDKLLAQDRCRKKFS